MQAEPRIVFIGGGSSAWVPNIVKDMLLTPSLQGARYVLFDIDRKAADTNRAFLEKLCGELGIRPRITATDSRARALRGADYVIITISTGGLDAMAHDLAIPQDYGIYHTVGDTSGPGGWARTMRNMDVFIELAEAIRQRAPDALVLNYTNPMTTLTDVLARLLPGRVVGLCHGLFENLRFIKEFYKLEGEHEISASYAGLNHFFWMTDVRAGSVDVVADLKARLQRTSLSELLRDTYADPMGYRSDREVASELLHQTGILPYFGDRHTCEFFARYITKKSVMKAYRIRRTSIDQRRKGFKRRAANLQRMLRGSIDERFRTRSRETAADIINAHVTGTPFIDVGNLPNTGQVANLPRGAVVETAVRVDRNGFAPVTFGNLPPAVLAMCEPWARVFTMQADAGIARDRRRALEALYVDPVCGHLPGRRVKEMGERLLKAHRRFLALE